MKPIPKLTERQTIRFWNRVQKGRSCWVWTGPDKVMLGGIKYKPARVAYSLACDAPKGSIIRLCSTENCVNPAHLKDVTEYEAGLRGYVGDVLKLRSNVSVFWHSLDRKRPVALLELVKQGKLL